MVELSIQKAVEALMTSRPCLLEALRRGIVNYSALARAILDEVAEISGRRPSPVSVKIALLRFSEKVRREAESLEERIRRIIAESTLQLVSDIAVVTLKDHPTRVAPMLAEFSESRFFQLTQGIGHLTIVLDKSSCDRLRRLLDEGELEMVVEDQAAIILVSPKDIVGTPGVISYLTSILASQGINITQIISCYVDTIFVVDRYSALRTYEALERLILSLRRKLGAESDLGARGSKRIDTK